MDGDAFVVFYSAPDVEEHSPDYQTVARLTSQPLAEAVAEALRGEVPIES